MLLLTFSPSGTTASSGSFPLVQPRPGFLILALRKAKEAWTKISFAVPGALLSERPARSPRNLAGEH